MRRENSAGFTLIELMVVVLIIGMVAATVVLSVGVTGRDRDMDKESERAVALLNYTREKAELQTHEFGLYFNNDAYEFLTYDPRKAIWRGVDEDDALRLREMPSGLTLHLTVEGRPVVLKDHAEDEKKYPTEKDKDRRDKERVPHVMLFSNGDLTPFQLGIERQDAGRSVNLGLNDKNKFEAEPLKEVARR